MEGHLLEHKGAHPLTSTNYFHELLHALLAAPDELPLDAHHTLLAEHPGFDVQEHDIEHDAEYIVLETVPD